MATPLAIQLLAPKPAVLVGQEPVLQIVHRVFADLDMETVALNRARTAIRIVAVDDGATLELTGQEHIRFHGIHPLTEIGARFRAPAGAEWTDSLHLLQYGAALGAGRYQVSLSYRYGETELETATAESVAFEVRPAEHLTNSYRWLGGATAYGELANLWRAEADGAIHWIYQIARRKNPGAIRSAVELAIPGDAAPFLPVVAHINGISEFYFERYVVWAEAESMGVVAVNPEGRNEEPRRYPHGLVDVHVAEPPLQQTARSITAVVYGRNGAGVACLAVMHLDESNTLTRTEIPLAGELPDFLVVAWPENKPSEAAVAYWGRRGEPSLHATPLRLPARSAPIALEGRLAGLAIEQWLGEGRVCALLAEEGGLRVASVPILAPPVVTIGGVDGPPEFVDFALPPGQGAPVYLRRGDTGWRIGEATVSRDDRLIHPHLLTTPGGGPWLVGFDAQRGFVVERLAPPEPPPLV